ncbi:MAG: hypothetical protein ACKOB7_05335 [Methylocystis sp.]
MAWVGATDFAATGAAALALASGLAPLAATGDFCSLDFIALMAGVFAAVSWALIGLAGVFAVGAGAGAGFSSAGALALLTGVFVP